MLGYKNDMFAAMITYSTDQRSVLSSITIVDLNKDN